MTREEYIDDDWTILEYDDDILETIDKINEQLECHDLYVEMADDEFDGWQPIKVIKLSS